MNKLIKILSSGVFVAAVGMTLVFPASSVSAAPSTNSVPVTSPSDTSSTSSSSSADNSAAKQEIQSGLDAVGGAKVSLKEVLGNINNVLIFLIGAIAVIVIVIGGIKYTTSQGDEKAVVSAKNTILYAVIGLVVAIAAYGIVSFILNVFL